MQYETLHLSLGLSLDPTIAHLRLSQDRIGKRTLQDIQAACGEVAASDDVRLLLVSAEGGSFCDGWEDDARDAYETWGPDPFGCLAELPIPVLAALHGRIAGPGLALALACDVRIARDDARFVTPDVAEGFPPLAGLGARLPRVTSPGVAASMLLLGEELDAEAAYRAGLVSRVLPRASFEAERDALCERIAANGPIALRYVKELVRNGLEVPLGQALRYELDLSVILQTTRDRAEGVQAFLEKRPPDFENR